MMMMKRRPIILILVVFTTTLRFVTPQPLFIFRIHGRHEPMSLFPRIAEGLTPEDQVRSESKGIIQLKAHDGGGTIGLKGGNFLKEGRN